MGSKERQGLLLDAFKIQTQAKKIAQEINFSRVQFTDGWFRGFKKRYDLHHKIAHGEKKSADTLSAEQWVKEVWPVLRALYALGDIYNCDETGLFFRGLPNPHKS